MERATRQRKAIWEYVQSSQRPLSPQELLEGARLRVPRLGIATVYRTINTLVREGRLVPVPIPGGPDRYERAGLQHHHHFYCRKCGKVFELEGCLLREGVRLPRGFTAEEHEVTLLGTCAHCS